LRIADLLRLGNARSAINPQSAIIQSTINPQSAIRNPEFRNPQ
jgi:hypothetical protein